jgi:hypothetical protein
VKFESKSSVFQKSATCAGEVSTTIHHKGGSEVATKKKAKKKVAKKKVAKKRK